MTLAEEDKKQNRKGSPQKSSNLNNAKRNIMGTSKFANEQIYKQNKKCEKLMYVCLYYICGTGMKVNSLFIYGYHVYRGNKQSEREREGELATN